MLHVLAFPHLGAADGRTIAAVRQAHDPQAAQLAPHVHLVRDQRVAAGPALAQLREAAATLWPCDAVLRRAMPWWTGSGPAEVRLLPDEGLSTLGRWHDSLHRLGSLFNAGRRPDEPFLPYIRLAAVGSHRLAQDIADDWNARRVVIRAVFSALVLGQFDAGANAPRFELLAQVPLGSPE